MREVLWSRPRKQSGGKGVQFFKFTYACNHPLPSHHLILPSERNVNSEHTISSDLIFF